MYKSLIELYVFVFQEMRTKVKVLCGLGAFAIGSLAVFVLACIFTLKPYLDSKRKYVATSCVMVRFSCIIQPRFKVGVALEFVWRPLFLQWRIQVGGQWRIQDFPEKGTSTTKMGATTYYFGQFSSKTA